MPLSDVNLQKFEELLLNKVDKLFWNYFEIDLNDHLLASNDYQISNPNKDLKTYLDEIVEYDSGAYQYPHGPLTGEAYREILAHVFLFIKKEPDVLAKAMERIFKRNRILNNSDAEEGKLGKFNAKDRNGRQKKFWKRINQGLRNKGGHFTILAEGDSWFQFPKLYFGIDAVNDIVDHLHNDEKYNTYSIAAGGDWLSNILHTGEFIDELPKINPDVFLISGGGNDMVGNSRLATMINTPGTTPSTRLFIFKERLKNLRKFDSVSQNEMYAEGLEHLNEEFFNFLNICFLQYFVFFHNLMVLSNKYKNLVFVTQGYDYAIPSNEKMRSSFGILQGLVNWFNNSGKWLFTPLMLKGINDPKTQKAILFAMIHEFNEMLCQLANFNGFPNLFHVDCRGFAKPDDWYDELHLKSNAFKKVSDVFKKCIAANAKMPNREMSEHKIWKVKDFL